MTATHKTSASVINMTGMWKIHTPNYFKEVLNNPTTWALARPSQIFADKLGQIAQRAVELGDEKLLKLCCDLTLFSESDPLSPDYDPMKVANLCKGGN